MQYSQPNSKLDMEPNPFEQSFSDLSPGKIPSRDGVATAAATVATQPDAPMMTIVVTSAVAGDTTKTVLPPIASMSGRLAVTDDRYNWDAQSLRMGPLSPSMLEGPQNPVSSNEPPLQGYNATLAEDVFPFPGPIAPQPQPQPQPQAQPLVQPQQHYSYPESTEAFGNLHLLSQATSRETWPSKQDHQQFPRANQYRSPTQPQQHHQEQHLQRGYKVEPTQSQVNQRLSQHEQAVTDNAPIRNTRKSKADSLSAQATRRRKMTSEEQSDDSDSSQPEVAERTSNGKKRAISDDKMDEEEKRKNFLERNRQAALKCRQRKKQWLANLQAKVEYLSTDNEHLLAQTTSMKDEIIHLKALLLAHKDCPVAQANGVYGDSIGVTNGHMAAPGRARGSQPAPVPHSQARMMQDITPSASPSQPQVSLRY
ncbi:hypothetical protein BGZ94_001300 [Podila epigama]|nr:hypothetical protein BGZ94_001300 [Podila epigama]